jgi:hypothetical protein
MSREIHRSLRASAQCYCIHIGYNSKDAMPAGGIEQAGAAYTWTFPICPHDVSVDLTVIGALQHCVSALSGPQQGLLMGRRRNGVTYIDACQPLPAFDTEVFTDAIETARRPIVGYYRIRDGRAFILEYPEIEMAKALFAEPGSVVLLVERRESGPAEGAFSFWRGPAFVSNLPHQFPIDAEKLPKTSPPPETAPALPVEGEHHAMHALRWQAGAVGVVAAGLLLVLLLPLVWVRNQHPVEPGEPAGPDGPTSAALPAAKSAPIAEPQGDLEISWDTQKTTGATGGLLRIVDGTSRRHIPLAPEQLRQGSAVYPVAAGPVSVELKALQANGEVLEIPVSTHSAAEPPPVRAQAAAAPAPPRQAQPEVTPRQTTAVAERRTPPRRFQLPLPERRTPARNPAIPDTPAAMLPVFSAAPLLNGALATSAPPPERPAPAPPERTAAAPAIPAVKGSGRLIWTGTLLRRGVVEFDSRTASIGSVSGGLPGVPVSVTISPAEFENDGLIVYTTDPKLDKHREPPNARNGWNNITYVWDPERVRQIAVLETPNASNRFAHLAVRSDARRCSMLLIDWSTQ